MIFTKERRKLLAKTLMDLAKLQGAGAVATTFFKDMPIAGRLAMAALFIMLIISGFLIQPESQDDKEE